MVWTFCRAKKGISLIPASLTTWFDVEDLMRLNILAKMEQQFNVFAIWKNNQEIG
jgi:hypothetical protein